MLLFYERKGEVMSISKSGKKIIKEAIPALKKQKLTNK